MEKVKITKKHLDKLKEELVYIETVVRPKNDEDLKAARDQGDLSENADYDAAREQQAYINSRLNEIRTILANYELIKPKFYTVYFLEKGTEATYELVGSQEANPWDNKISDESPLGKAIEGASAGDKVIVHSNGKDFEVEIRAIK